MKKEAVIKFKKYYSKHLELFVSPHILCDDCPLDAGTEFGLSCENFIFELFGVRLEKHICCDSKLYISKKCLQKYARECTNKI